MNGGHFGVCLSLVHSAVTGSWHRQCGLSGLEASCPLHYGEPDRCVAAQPPPGCRVTCVSPSRIRKAQTTKGETCALTHARTYRTRPLSRPSNSLSSGTRRALLADHLVNGWRAGTGETVIEELLHVHVGSAEVLGDAEIHFFAEERGAVAYSAPRNRREIAAVRRCARAALGELGNPSVLLPPGWHTSPQWPAETVGSSACRSRCPAAAVAGAGRLHSVGIDAEVGAPRPGSLLDLTALPTERDLVERLGARSDAMPWGLPVSAGQLHEGRHSAWSPLTRRMPAHGALGAPRRIRSGSHRPPLVRRRTPGSRHAHSGTPVRLLPGTEIR